MRANGTSGPSRERVTANNIVTLLTSIRTPTDQIRRCIYLLCDLSRLYVSTSHFALAFAWLSAASAYSEQESNLKKWTNEDGDATVYVVDRCCCVCCCGWVLWRLLPLLLTPTCGNATITSPTKHRWLERQQQRTTNGNNTAATEEHIHIPRYRTDVEPKCKKRKNQINAHKHAKAYEACI